MIDLLKPLRIANFRLRQYNQRVDRNTYLQRFQPYSEPIPCLNGDYESFANLAYFFLNPFLSMHEKHKRFIFKIDPLAKNIYYSRNEANESFCRSFIGASYLISAESKRKRSNDTLKQLICYYSQGILEGTNSNSSEYFGDTKMLVDNTSLIIGLFLTEDTIWNAYNRNEKQQIADYFRRCTNQNYFQNNWLWFVIMHKLFLQRMMGEDYSKEMRGLLQIIERWYLGEGWYSDGNMSTGIDIDYYGAYGFQYYALLFTMFAPKEYECQKKIFINRGVDFMKTYQYFFTPGATHPPFGRSQYYRFAALAPIGLLLASKDQTEIDLDRLKTSFIDNINSFLSKDIFDQNGFLTLGFLSAWPNIAEPYSASGSPYWALKAFSILLLSEDHPFWEADRNIKPSESITTIKSTNQLLVHNGFSEIKLFNIGVTHTLYPSKYNKFVYSNLFPGDNSKENNFPDNTLLLKRDAKRSSASWDSRGMFLASHCDSNVCWGRWIPSKLRGVIVTTLLAGFSDGYLFVHSISSSFPLFIKLGGFLIEEKAHSEFCHDKSLVIKNEEKGSSSLLYVAGECNGTLTVESTTNTIDGRRCICPVFHGSIKKHQKGVSVCGWIGASMHENMNDNPEISIASDHVILLRRNKEFRYNLNSSQII